MALPLHLGAHDEEHDGTVDGIHRSSQKRLWGHVPSIGIGRSIIAVLYACPPLNL